MQRRQAYYMIDAASVVENVNHGSQKIPENERQARPLTKLDPEQQVEAWQKVVETAPDGKVTAKHVKKVADQMAGRVKRKQKEKEMSYEVKDEGRPPEGEVAMKYARMAVSDLEKMYRHHHDRQEALDYVEDWIKRNR